MKKPVIHPGALNTHFGEYFNDSSKRQDNKLPYGIMSTVVPTSSDVRKSADDQMLTIKSFSKVDQPSNSDTIRSKLRSRIQMKNNKN